MNPETRGGAVEDRFRSSSSNRHDEIVTLRPGTGHETTVRLTDKEKIGEGAYAKTYRASVLFPSDDEEKIQEVRARLVVKEFKKGSGNAEKAVAIREALEASGVHTWRTFRIVDGRDSVAMTDGKRKGGMIVSSSDSSRDKETFWVRPANRMEFSEEAFRMAVQDAVSAGNGGIIVPPDAWLTELVALEERKRLFASLRQPDKGVSVKSIFVGDYDGIEIPRLSIFQYEYDALREKEMKDLTADPLRTARLNLLNLKSGFDETVNQVADERRAKMVKRAVEDIVNEEGRRIDALLGQNGKWKELVEARKNRRFVGSAFDTMGVNHRFQEE